MTDKYSTEELNQILRQNCFGVFNLPLKYNIDKNLLNKTYQLLQKNLHPDNFVNHADNLLSVKVSAHINDAYRILNSPLLKAIELLRLNGITFDLDTNKELPADFLMLQMELYEEIDEAHGDTEKLTDIADLLDAKLNQLDSTIEQNFVNNDYLTVADNIKKLAFYTKLIALVGQKIEESW